MQALDDSPSSKQKPFKKPVNQYKSFKTLSSVKQIRNMRTLNTPKKKKVTSVHKLEEFANDMSLIINGFLSSHGNQKKVKLFIQTFEHWLNGTYLDVLLIIRQFSDFNLFDHINVSCTYHDKMTQKEISQKTEMISIRNNIALSILVVAKEIEYCEKIGEIDFNQKEPLFSDLRFLNPLIERFKTLIIETDSHFSVSVDVELFFLAILDYKDKARMIKQKFTQYFKDLIIDCNIPKYNFDYFLTIAVDKHEFLEYTTEELILLRRIFRNAALRNFYFGIEYLLKTVDYSYILSEGRIWKCIGMKMQPFNVYNLWVLYEEKIDEIREVDLRETLSLEYEEKIASLNKLLSVFTKEQKISDEYNRILYEKKSYEKEIQLYNVTCLKEVLVIFFQSDLKELVLYFFQEYLNSSEEQKIPIEIFEICLDYDEDISM